MSILSSLPDDFKPLITALDAVAEKDLNFEKMKNMVMNDFYRNYDYLRSKIKRSKDTFAIRQTNRFFKKGTETAFYI